jgi:site-specific DNA recombinase
MIQHRSQVKSIRIKKRTIIPPENQISVMNTHPALISEDEFRQVQEKLKHKGLKRSNGQESIFAHIAVCADCGMGMHYKKDRNAYQCGRYGRYGRMRCSSHLIKYDFFLTQVKEALKQLKLGGKVHMKTLIDTVNAETSNQTINYKKKSLVKLKSGLDYLFVSKAVSLSNSLREILQRKNGGRFILPLEKS